MGQYQDFNFEIDNLLRFNNHGFNRLYLYGCRPSVCPSSSIMDVLWLSVRSWGKLFTRIISFVS